MKQIFKTYVHYISTKFPSIFLNYLRSQLETSELKNSSLYEITKVAHAATSLDDLYKSIHANISKLMYADNMFIAIHDKDNNLISLLTQSKSISLLSRKLKVIFSISDLLKKFID